MALLASGTYLEDKNMAVMNPMGGGIDTDVQNRMMQLRNDPNALGQQAQKSGDILDLIAARRAADLVAEQKKMLALQMNGSPATVKDQVEKELVDGQKAEMRGPLQSLQGKTQGVAGVLQNQQQQQGRGQPQGQPMRAAMGGIINAPAPNLNRMYNGGIVGYKKGGEISREEYIEKVKALVASGVEQKDAMAQMDKEFDILSGTREERRDVTLEDNRLLPRGNRRSIRADEVYKTQAPGTETRNTRNIFMGKSTQGNQPYSVPDPEGDLLAAIAGEKQPKPEPDSTQRVLGTTPMTMGQEPIAGDMNQDLGAMIEVNEGKIKPIRELKEPVVKKTGIASALPEGDSGFSPVLSKEERGKNALKNLGLDKEQDNSMFEAYKPKVNPNQSPTMTPEQQAAARPKPKTPVELLQEKLDALDGKKGVAGLVERFANTKFKKSYGSNSEALASGLRDIAETGSDEKARERKFLEDQLGVQQSIEAAQVEATAKESEFGRGLAETQAARKQAGNEFDQKFKQLGTQFDETLKQNGDYQDAKLEVDKRSNEIRAITEGNNTALLSSKNKSQVFAILQTMRNDYDTVIELEVGNILNRPGEDYAAKKAAADAHRKTRNTEFANLQASLVGTLGGGSGGSGGSSAKAAASKILGT